MNSIIICLPAHVGLDDVATAVSTLGTVERHHEQHNDGHDLLLTRDQ
jgi:hypothetical protein